ncbi:MAG: helix-turn-helix transcriptional regulator [Acidimicrobiales bacterium]
MADTATRTLRLLSLLQRRRRWPAADLADRLEVSPRTLRRDIDRLRTLGYAVDSDRGVDGGYRLRGSTGDTALLLDAEEVIALVVALHSAARGATELSEASLGALTKTLSMLGPDQQARADNVRRTTDFGPSADRAAPALSVLDAVTAACRDHLRLSFDYAPAQGAPARRYVEPCRVVALQQRWYVVAYDCDRCDWRTFRLDRMTVPELARNSFTPRTAPAADLYEYVRGNRDRVGATTHVVIDVEAAGAEVRARFGAWVSVDDLDTGRCRITMDVDSFHWPTHIVTTLDAPVTIIEPPELRLHLSAVAARLSAAAGNGLTAAKP